MKILKVKFMYRENKILYHSFLGTPIYGNQIYMKFLGQVFIENFEVISNKANGLSYKRNMAMMFGKKLQQIGKNIERQATLGKKQKIKVNGKKLKSF